MRRLLLASLLLCGLAPALSASAVRVSVDWDRTVGVAPREAYSLNAFHSFNPAIPAEPRYRENIAYINPGALRYHCSAIVRDSRTDERGWLDHGTRAWDVEKIRRATAAWPASATVQITLHSWPSYMEEGPEHLLAKEHYDDYAALCADLVRIVNIELGLGVTRWEPMNERELAYDRALRRNGKPPRYDEMIEIFNRCAVAMKRVDPSIRVGGPAISSAAWTGLIREFVRGAGANLDFFTCHYYVTNDTARPDEAVFDSAADFGAHIAAVRKIIAEELPGRELPVELNEYNINWTWEARDPRMINHKGAVFDALVMSSVLTSGAAATYAWNDVDNIYGKMSRAYALRPSAHVYHHLNARFLGDIAAAASTAPRVVAPYAVASGAGPALMLVNRSAEPAETRLDQTGAKGWPAGSRLARIEISDTGVARSTLAAASLAGDALTLPPLSVTFLHVSEAASATGDL